MQTRHAAIAGASIGLLAGCAICLIIGASFSDTLFRVSILVIGGAWMGVILAWLNQLLTPKLDERLPNGQQGRRL